MPKIPKTIQTSATFQKLSLSSNQILSDPENSEKGIQQIFIDYDNLEMSFYDNFQNGKDINRSDELQNKEIVTKKRKMTDDDLKSRKKSK